MIRNPGLIISAWVLPGYISTIFTLTAVDLEMDVDYWAARGFVTAFFAVPLGLAAKRSFRLSLDNHIPRKIVLYSFVAIAAGAFIALLIMGEYYIKNYAGTWGSLVRIILFVGANPQVVVMGEPTLNWVPPHLTISTATSQGRSFLTRLPWIRR